MPDVSWKAIEPLSPGDVPANGAFASLADHTPRCLAFGITERKPTSASRVLPALDGSTGRAPVTKADVAGRWGGRARGPCQGRSASFARQRASSSRRPQAA